MANFAIITDTGSDMTTALCRRFGIDDILRGYLTFPDGHTERADPDCKNISPEDFFTSMSDKKHLYSTSILSIGEAQEVYEKYLSQGRDILVVTLSGGMSGTFNCCQMAANDILKKYPERKIICVDSRRYSTAIALLCITAAQKRDEGMSLEDTAAFLEENKNRIHQMGPLDDLFFLHRVGRVPRSAAVMGSLIGIRPLADFNGQTGMSEVLAKTRGTKAAFAHTVEYMRQTGENLENRILFISHSNRPEGAETLKKMIEQAFHPKEIIVCKVGQGCGPNIGPGLVAVYFMGKPISQDVSEEKAIMAKIVGKEK